MKASYTPVGLAIINESTPGLSAPYPVLDNVLNVLHDDPDSGFPMLQFRALSDCPPQRRRRKPVSRLMSGGVASKLSTYSSNEGGGLWQLI